VACQGSTGGLCTPTEAILVALDITKGTATAAGNDPAGGCYSCLETNGCVDDTVGDTNHECGDLSGNFTNGSGTMVPATSTCIATLQCVVNTGCGLTNGGLTNCYCGAGGGTPTNCATAAGGAAVNGACLSQEVTGFAHVQSNSSAILGSDFTNATEPSGRANQIISCGQVGNKCPQCLQ
jgi:hypothetical protein